MTVGLVGEPVQRLMGNTTARREYNAVARTAVPSGARDAKETGAKAGEGSDAVEWSDAVPDPLASSTLRDALRTGESIRSGAALRSGTQRRLREDRIFLAVAALATYAEDGMASPPAWPGGLPSPTAAELEAAYRRLSQRVDGATASEEPLRAERIALRERYRGVHFPDLADALETLRSGADTADTSAE